jgi:hypothetical protein
LRRWASYLPDVLLVLGAILVPVGIGLVHRPSALAILGVEFLLFGLLISITTGRR